MAHCSICLNETDGGHAYHPACLRQLFGTETLPNSDTISRGTIYQQAAELVGKMSISGVQEKVSLALSADKGELRILATPGRYILKPESAIFPSLPPNEHVTMRIASLVGIETPPFGLLWLNDGSAAYIIKRFDRLDHGTKLQVEDFCQLSEDAARDKYRGSGEQCVGTLKRFASDPSMEIRKLFKLSLFSWWVANGDHHLKNLSLLTTLDGVRRLSSAYDLLCTRLVLPNDRKLSLPIDGRKAKLTRKTWLNFAAYCEIPPTVAERLLAEQIDALAPSIQLIRNSFLPDELKNGFIEIINTNAAILSA